MINPKLTGIFAKGSKTYFISSLFFPKNVKEDVFKLYAFVRVFDNFVDNNPQDIKGFCMYKRKYNNTLKTNSLSGDLVLDSFIETKKRLKIPDNLINSFFDSMYTDAYKKRYKNFDDLGNYIYGSAGVIGIMLAKIFNLDKKSLPYAVKLGSAMQFANFIRDIKTDLTLGRIYIPMSELRKNGLKDFSNTEDCDKYINLIKQQCQIYFDWQSEAEKGFHYIPKRFLIPVKTASDMYKWTVGKIYKNPLIVFRKSVKPSRARILFSAVINSITL